MRKFLIAASALALVVACGGSEAAPVDGNNTPYTSDPNKTVVVGAGAEAVQATPGSSGCVTLPSGQCVDPQTVCKEGERTDVVVDSAGKIVATVCYPADATPTVVDQQGNVELGKTGNNEVVALDGAADGVDIAGNVTSKGNNVTVYGQGPDVSVIGGNVTAEGNGFALRGVTVKGDVEVSGGNNAVLVLCVIEGNVILHGNNNVIADCIIRGNVTIDGVNNVLVSNKIGGTITLADAKNSVCDGNVAWSDANGNMLFDPGESGAALTCEAPKK